MRILTPLLLFAVVGCHNNDCLSQKTVLHDKPRPVISTYSPTEVALKAVRRYKTVFITPKGAIFSAKGNTDLLKIAGDQDFTCGQEVYLALADGVIKTPYEAAVRQADCWRDALKRKPIKGMEHLRVMTLDKGSQA